MNIKFLIPLVPFVLMTLITFSQTPLVLDFNKLNNSHDLSLPSWGPYSKTYAGISHIHDVHSGIRFDFSVAPGFYRNKILVPNVQFESGYFPWHAANDLSQYTYRYELEWKDKVFVDVTYTIEDSASVMVSIRCVNNTPISQNLSLNLLSTIAYADPSGNYELANVNNSVWIRAVDYEALSFSHPRPKDNLVTDGWMRGEIRSDEFIDGCALGRDFGKDAGDQATYAIEPPSATGMLSLIYRMKENDSSKFRLSGAINADIKLAGTGKLTTFEIPYQSSTEKKLTLHALGGAPIELNGLLMTAAGEQNLPIIQTKKKEFSPQVTSSTLDKELVFKYKDIPTFYGLKWSGDEDFHIRQIKNDELDIFFKRMVHNHVTTVLKGNSNGEYQTVYLRPVFLEPQSEKTISVMLVAGGPGLIKAKLGTFESFRNKNAVQLPNKLNPEIAPDILPEGEKFNFSQKMLKATVLTDVVYPIYTQRDFIRHFTPGKWWNSLYTWDSGFIALGLAEINIELATECLNAYTTPSGSQSAFIHHGSPVPVQFYAFQEIWNKTQSKEALQYFYPRLKQYYEFLAGRYGSSTTRALRSNLLKTWDYFYNSGGWDDYPAQVEVHRIKAEKTIAPVINTAQQIRIAKILSMAAEALGKKADRAIYEKDIRDFSYALQTFSWDAPSGYFGYVTHDSTGQATGILKNEKGYNFNMGLDGAYPLISGICTPRQQSTLLDKIFSEKHMWTPAGICVVDQSAPYYRTDGYWNGAVWFSHQWFVWKTMLDLGRTDLAFRIADNALGIYKKETDESYYTFEHFLADSGRGAGWHQFSGLSNPILSWFASYYKIGSVTTGFEIWIKKQSMTTNHSQYLADLSFDKATAAHRRSMLVCLNPQHRYEARFNGKKIETESPFPGMLYVHLPATNQPGQLVVSPSAGEH